MIRGKHGGYSKSLYYVSGRFIFLKGDETNKIIDEVEE